MDLLKKKIEVAAPLELPEALPKLGAPPAGLPVVPGATPAAVSGVGK